MLQTYKAILRGNQLEWDDTAPQDADRPLAVHVTILEQQPSAHSASSGQRMAAILEQLSQCSTLRSIADPVAWQREQRNDQASS